MIIFKFLNYSSQNDLILKYNSLGFKYKDEIYQANLKNHSIITIQPLIFNEHNN
jgi:hypothetical protein